MNALSRIPWKLSSQSKRVVLSDGDTRICEAQTADAAFIVRACNSHAALVAALSAVIANPRSAKAWEDAEAAFALAHTAQGDV